MKFSKKSITLLATGIVMIMVICLTTLYNNNGEQQSELLSQLDLIQPVIAKSSTREVSSRIQDIEQRQIEAESQMKAAKAQLQQPINAIVITDTLLDIAQITGVEIDKLNSPGIADTNIGDLGFTVLPIKLEVVGEVINLIDFISEFSKTYPTGLIKSVQMNIPTEDEETEAGDPENFGEVSLPSASLEIQIYSCEDV
jgi:hypothetical protein